MNKYITSIEKSLKIIEKHLLISSSDLNGVIIGVSDALCNKSGYSKTELIGQNHTIFKHPDVENSVFKELWETILSGEEWEAELKNKNKDGSYYWADVLITPEFSEAGKVSGFTAIYKDITDRKNFETVTVTDQLTNISNRRHLETSIQREVFRAQRYKTTFSTILLDIDMFKSVNEIYGHDAGDFAITTIAEILKNNIRNTDSVGRWSGGEFLILCPEIDADEAKIVAEKLRTKIEEFKFERTNRQTCSFGVSQYRTEDTGSNEIIHRADRALYEAKYSGRNMVVVTKL